MNYEWSWWWPRRFGVHWWLRNMGIIAPFWATTDTYLAFRDGHSSVYYQVYSQNKESSSEILNMASQDVKRYTDGDTFADFTANWVLVVTWHMLCPYVDNYDNNNNCRWVRTLLSILLQSNLYITALYIAATLCTTVTEQLPKNHPPYLLLS